jgi:hypothetical protein
MYDQLYSKKVSYQKKSLATLFGSTLYCKLLILLFAVNHQAYDSDHQYQ